MGQVPVQFRNKGTTCLIVDKLARAVTKVLVQADKASRPHNSCANGRMPNCEITCFVVRFVMGSAEGRIQGLAIKIGLMG